MNRPNTLTGEWKIMNMPKLGIVSLAGNSSELTHKPRRYRDCSVMTYTLCATDHNQSWHSWRYGFAFYIPAISCRSPLGQSPASEVRVLCNTRTLSPMGETPLKPAQLLASRAAIFSEKIETVPALGRIALKYASSVIRVLCVPEDHQPENPRRYWLPEPLHFRLTPKLFRLAQLGGCHA